MRTDAASRRGSTQVAGTHLKAATLARIVVAFLPLLVLGQAVLWSLPTTLGAPAFRTLFLALNALGLLAYA
ncbi:hypothetical protein PAGU2595_024030 [Lysobacter xanthus]